MDPSDAWNAALVAVTAVHLGFQLSVTLVVYPALVVVAPSAWVDAHAGHGRRIAPLVAVLYGAALVTGVGALVTDPGVGTVLAGGAVGAITLTAGAAAPIHGRLGAGPEPTLLARLVHVDRWRTVAAATVLAGALVAG